MDGCQGSPGLHVVETVGIASGPAAWPGGSDALAVANGGGQGAFLAALLAEHPETRGVLFDQPQVVPAGEEIMRAAGVADRCTIVGGDFFDEVPEGGNAYVLQGVLHILGDDDAVAVLRSCRRAVGAGGAVLVLERELGAPNEKPEAKFADLNMLVRRGGKERTLEEYGALFATAGFRLRGMTPSRSGIDIIEAATA